MPFVPFKKKNKSNKDNKSESKREVKGKKVDTGPSKSFMAKFLGK